MSRAENIPSIIQLSSSFDDRLLFSSSSNLSRFLERSSNNFFTADLFSDVDNDVFSLDIVFNFSPEKKVILIKITSFIDFYRYLHHFLMLSQMSSSAHLSQYLQIPLDLL